MALEVPPGNPVLHRDQYCRRMHERIQLGSDRIDLMRLDAENDEVLWSGFAHVARRFDIRRNALAAGFGYQPQPATADCIQMSSARDYGYFVAGVRKQYGEIAPDRACP